MAYSIALRRSVREVTRARRPLPYRHSEIGTPPTPMRSIAVGVVDIPLGYSKLRRLVRMPKHDRSLSETHLACP